VQLAERLARHHGALRTAGGVQRRIGGDGDEGVELGPSLDPRQRRLHRLDGRDFTTSDRRG
jgi:hypothetical protein